MTEMRNVLKSRLTAGILILVVVCLGIVFAGDVIVKEGVIEGVKFKSTGCTATGTKAVAFGYETVASEPYSTAMGYQTEASGDYSTAMGAGATASGGLSTAIGFGTTTTESGMGSIAMGYLTTASNTNSTAMGTSTTASGSNSTAMGYVTTAGPANYTTAIGKYSTNDIADSFTVGYGTYETDAVDFRVQSGQVNVYGDLDVSQKITTGTLVLPVKTDTDDPASPVEGQIYVNTYDNKVRVYADGDWRDLATW